MDGLRATIPDVFAGVFILAGGLIMARAVWRYRATVAAVRRAEQASGTINRVAIQPVHGGSSTSYVLAVDYTYQTPTQRLRGETVYPGENRFATRFVTREAAQRAVTPYEEGDQTTTYYDPHSADHSFLTPEPRIGAAVGPLGLGGGLVTLGIFIAVIV